ncbi:MULTISPECIES: AAA family ATPase [Bradyrhizobium]|uniref:AAA family ATPase n=1 Tax=Bradyrhizobium liaoningense TaxID=43992 RepID=UPI001BA6C010|nr:AAA family ATPase [Bradyrhizobium liaoningense]MBR0879653.1 AAA family ATPase [Bradyrhizobium liaoningense]
MADFEDEDNTKVVPLRARLPRILTSEQFVRGFVPPDYLLDGMLQRRFFYSLTGKTGAGKTAIMLLLAAHSALGQPLLEREVDGGKVLYLAGENADDVRMRWIAMAQQMDFDISSIDVNFIPGVFKITEMYERVRAEIVLLGDVVAIFIDTSAAFFEGVDENDNKQSGDHARLLRRFTEMPGRPCVIAACHPVKNATDDNLVPRGGGAFLAEVDGNLAAKAHDGSIEISAQGKFRGPDFAPVTFQLRTVTHQDLKDSKGRLIPTVVASPLSEVGREEIAKTVHFRENELLVALADPANRAASLADLARACKWFMSDGQPYKVLVQRMLKSLIGQKLVVKKRGGRYALTGQGAQEIAEDAG